MEALRQRVRRGEVTIGSWMSLGSPAIAEIMADAGFEWLVIDLEHSVTTLREAESLIRVIELKGCTPLVRVTSNNSDQIKRVMDAGAHGVIVPMVNTPEDARAAARAVRYPPQGTRGVGLGRAQGYGARFAEYAAQINETAVVIAQIEHVDALRNLEAILTTEGIDGSLIGPYDLSASLGKPGRYDDPDVVDTLQGYEQVSRRLEKPMGYHVIEPDHAGVLDYIRRGYTFLAFSVDFLFLGETCRAQMTQLRTHLRV